jgi:flagellar basal body-associated protein FliL
VGSIPTSHPKKRKEKYMIPIEAIIGLTMLVWYVIWSVTVFKNQRKQSDLQEKIFNESVTQTNALNDILMELKDLNSKHK